MPDKNNKSRPPFNNFRTTHAASDPLPIEVIAKGGRLLLRTEDTPERIAFFLIPASPTGNGKPPVLVISPNRTSVGAIVREGHELEDLARLFLRHAVPTD